MANGLSFPSLVREIQNRVNILEVAESLGMAIAIRGNNKRAVCPFHADNEPSLSFFESGKTGPHYHCFACGAHGDVFNLVKERKSCDFREAVNWLAEHYGLSSRIQDVRAVRGKLVTKPKPTDAYEIALEIYKRRNGIGKIKAWMDLRSLPHSLIDNAGIVYALPGTLTAELNDLFEKNGDWRVVEASLEEAKLITVNRKNTNSNTLFVDFDARLRDFFGDERVLFPVRGLDDKLVGFAGRSIHASNGPTTPKYLYSNGLPKSTILYRGNVARKLLLEQSKDKPDLPYVELYICEGIIDALRLESLGFNAVAILGAQASKGQVDDLAKLANELHGTTSLRCNIFLDRDGAGIKGSAKLAIELAKLGIDAAYIWATTSELNSLNISATDQKDPDSILKRIEKNLVGEHLERWRQASGLPVMAEKLGANVTPDDIVLVERWQSISLGRKYKAAIDLGRDQKTSTFLLDFKYPSPHQPLWRVEVQQFRHQQKDSSANKIHEARQSVFIDLKNARFQNARALARSGAARGEVPTDEAAWRRLDVGGTSFSIGFQEQLARETFRPLEPLDAVLVSRGFGNDEPRLKAMPCPEDLVIQQYLLSEILTERFDIPSEENQFSTYIPAVRFYRDRSVTETTAEDSTFQRHEETLSFAYQIDMDVLEGRRACGSQGMFRPYIECWRDFIGTLRRKAEPFSQVYALRLDVKRYYDRLTRSTIRDRLVLPFSKAIEQLVADEQIELFAPDFSEFRQNLPEALVDWFCDQSFDYEYYDPYTGRIATSSPNVGIPQGPILSAWLATVALFPLDSALRTEIKKIKVEAGEDTNKVAYARYVDDIFIIAENLSDLQRLRSVAEDWAKVLRLELVDKGSEIPPMTAIEFREWLATGKAFVGSGPRPEIELLNLGDGEVGSDTWHTTEIQRSSALELLSDRRLYTLNRELFDDQLYTALQATDLRPAELPKLCRWIWYAAAENQTENAQTLWSKYWLLWNDLTKNSKWQLDPNIRAWDDPLLYALDGLEVALLSSRIHDTSVSGSLSEIRNRRIRTLATCVLEEEFFDLASLPLFGAPQNTGIGARKLARIFRCREISIRWVASQLVGDFSPREDLQRIPSNKTSIPAELNASLTRAWITKAETLQDNKFSYADLGDSLSEKSILRSQFIWLHRAIALLGKNTSFGNDDPLQSIEGLAALWSKTTENEPLKFGTILSLLVATQPNQLVAHDEAHRLALSTLLSVCPVNNVVHCLQNRTHLLESIFNRHPLPALPGVELPYLTLIDIAQERNESTEPLTLRSVHQISTLDSLNQESAFDYLRSANGDAERIHLNWLPRQINGLELKIFESDWDRDADKIFKNAPVKPNSFDFGHLKWAADAFDSLARINFQEENETRSAEDGVGTKEFLPAWPFLVFTVSPAEMANKKMTSEPLSISNIGYLLSREALGKFAFARDGRGRLKSFEVPLSDAWLWRIGFAVTDVLGLTSELDRYGKLGATEVSMDGNAADYILREMLRRLRGEFASSSQLPRHSQHPHLPAGTFRALELLRNFPKNSSSELEVAYVLSVESESRAMERRIARNWNFDLPGETASFIEGVASRVMFRFSKKWVGVLPDAELKTSRPLRRAVAAWLTLDSRLHAFEMALVSSGQNSFQDTTWTLLRHGVRFAAIKAWLKAIALELDTEGRFSNWGVSDASNLWGLEDPSLVIDDLTKDPVLKFKKAVSREGSMAGLNEITPLGWLFVICTRLNIYSDESDETSFDIETKLSFQENANLLSRVLSFVPGTSILERPTWPLEWANADLSPFSSPMVFEECIQALFGIDDALGYRTKVVTSEQWGVKARSDRFQDTSGRSWVLAKTLIDQLSSERHIESYNVNTGFVFTWTETYSKSDQLVGVSVLGQKFAESVGITSERNEKQKSMLESILLYQIAKNMSHENHKVVDGVTVPISVALPDDLDDVAKGAESSSHAELSNHNDSQTSDSDIGQPIKQQDQISVTVNVEADLVEDGKSPRSETYETNLGEVHIQVPTISEVELPSDQVEPTEEENNNRLKELSEDVVTVIPAENESAEIEDTQTPKSISPNIEATQEAAGPNPDSLPNKEDSPLDTSELNFDFNKWNRRQLEIWSTNRKFRADCHVRVAIFQFRIDDSYRHPLVDVGFSNEAEEFISEKVPTISGTNQRKSMYTSIDPSNPSNESETETDDANRELDALNLAASICEKSGQEYHWTASWRLPSWVEHRRRMLLEAALRSCDAFNVDVLVLPEYSVRPDTVAWLKEKIFQTGSNVSVIAGTYRIHGNKRDLHFLETFKDILGTSEWRIASEPTGTQSIEQAAVITLLQPYSWNGSRDVATFTRRKKYPSIALGEVFNPGNTDWAPLLGWTSFLGQVCQSKRILNKPTSPEDGLSFAHQSYPATYMSELICSELFATTSLANAPNLMDAYSTLCKRFGHSITDGDSLKKDFQRFSDTWAFKAKGERRRTILVVPAMTTRSSDYLIYGQSQLLAAGITTVFCSAVHKDSSGGSCFIGKSSSVAPDRVPGMVSPNTPYSGWSHGVYYNQPTDPLGVNEQAIVIADIDPIYMNEGKPRPQTLPIPIQLVAHLPIIEMINPSGFVQTYAGAFKQSVSGIDVEKISGSPFKGVYESAIVSKTIAKLYTVLETSQTKIVDPNEKNETTGQSTLSDSLELTNFLTDKHPMKARLNHWSENWRALPYMGPPPSVIDFVLVDLTPDVTSGLPKIFVPPWSSQK